MWKWFLVHSSFGMNEPVYMLNLHTHTHTMPYYISNHYLVRSYLAPLLTLYAPHHNCTSSLQLHTIVVCISLYHGMHIVRGHTPLYLHTSVQLQSNTESSVMWFTLLDVAMTVAVTIGQVYYVQHLINTRSWV